MFEITIHEPVIPYVRMTQRSKWNSRSQAYLSNQHLIRWYIEQACICNEHTIYDRVPLSVTAHFKVIRLHRGDLDNLVKAIMDAAQGVVYGNDGWIDAIVATRVQAQEPSVYLRVDPLTSGGTGYDHDNKSEEAGKRQRSKTA